MDVYVVDKAEWDRGYDGIGVTMDGWGYDGIGVTFRVRIRVRATGKVRGSLRPYTQGFWSRDHPVLYTWILAPPSA